MTTSGVSLTPYRQALASPALRTALVLGILVRAPVFASGVLLTVHVVAGLGHSYAAAGFVGAVSTLAFAISGPWRGRLLDRFGLRRVILPSIIVAVVCWSIAPFVSYWPLVMLAFVAGILVIPAFSIMRQAVIAAVPEDLRRTGIALDSAAVELSFMLAPALAVWAATQWSTAWVLLWTQMIGVGAGIVLFVVDPPLRGEGEAEVGSARVSRRSWFSGPFVAVCLAGAATTVVLSGSDIGIVATMREFDATSRIGLVLALWALGSLIGGLLYGALPRPVPAPWLLGGLAVVTQPMALAHSPWGLAWLSFVAGLLCAPTITATVDQASRLVPAEARGEAMGWHASFMTTGSAMGAPLAGFAIDRGGPGAGFVIVAVLGLMVALGGMVAMRSPAAEARGSAPAG
jgi:MFS family permease